jgi:5-methylthioadenosine/S-adenosylhomocysteine deaminase
MRDRPGSVSGSGACSCNACGSLRGDLSRRQFLCSGAIGTIAAPALAASLSGAAQAQEAGPVAGSAGRPLLIKGGCVLTLDRALGDFERADVLVEGRYIAAVRPDIDAPNAEIIDASEAIVMPGFIDTHRHMWQGILRNILPDASLQDYFQAVQRTIGPHYTPDDVYAGILISALGAIDVGVTTVLDWSHIQNSPEHSDANINALHDSGIRAVFGYGNPDTASGRFWEDTKHRFPDDIKRLRGQYFSSDDQLLTLCLASPSGPST